METLVASKKTVYKKVRLILNCPCCKNTVILDEDRFSEYKEFTCYKCSSIYSLISKESENADLIKMNLNKGLKK